MKLLPALLISTALAATAGTSMTTISGFSVSSVTKVRQPIAAPNADQDITDLGNRPNLPIGKGPGGTPVAPSTPRTVTTARPALPVSPPRDRCSSETRLPGKAQPMCFPA